MSESLLSFEPLTDADAPDEAVELGALERALSFSEGFSLLFACAHPSQNRRLKKQLGERLPALEVLDLDFTKPLTHLLDELRARLSESQPGTVWVSGLENSVNPEDVPREVPLIANLNAARNSFAAALNCPLVLWVPQYVLTAIIQGAPDFFSIRSGTYYFSTTPQESRALAQSLVAGAEWQAISLPVKEKQERLAVIQKLLNDYQLLPSAQRDRVAEMNLLSRAGDILSGLSQHQRAIKFYEQVLAIAREVGDKGNEANALGNLGVSYDYLNQTNRSIELQKETLSLSREIGERNIEGAALSNLGSAYLDLGQFQKAIEFYEQALAIAREISNRNGEGTVLTNLGNAYSYKGQLQRSIELHEKALSTAREIGDRRLEGSALGNLGNIHQGLGQFQRSIKFYEQALTLVKDIGNKSLEGVTLTNLGAVYQNLGQFQRAIKLHEQALSIAREVGNKESERITRRHLNKIYKQQLAEKSAISKLIDNELKRATAPEITPKQLKNPLKPKK